MDTKKSDINKNSNTKKEVKGTEKVSGKQTQKSKKTTSKKVSSSKPKTDKTLKELEELKAKLSEMNDKYLRLSAEYDNFRKRTLKEKMELTKTGGEDILLNILPVVDDFERALGSMDKIEDIKALKEGIMLIYNKFIDFLKSRGVKEIEAMHQKFNTDEHEALTQIPAPNKKLKGKVVDVIEKGYYLHDKIIRFSKVVVGQ
ncbi:MAG: nucleotide exchange factor GrpE [Chlorobi bacterium]|nr:nucleotide exchange factor GrpE [Chlorobiota bacterium]